MMIGTLQLCRALADRQVADTVLAQGIQNILALWAPATNLTRSSHGLADLQWPSAT